MARLTTELKRSDQDVWILKLVGSVDVETYHLMWFTDSSGSLLKSLLAADARQLVIDLSGTERFDSHGLRMLLNAQKEFSRENVKIVLKNPNDHLKRLFQIMQFDRVFEVELED